MFNMIDILRNYLSKRNTIIMWFCFDMYVIKYPILFYLYLYISINTLVWVRKKNITYRLLKMLDLLNAS